MRRLLALALALGLGHGLLHASPVIQFAAGNLFDTAGISASPTTGASMTGMKVEACFIQTGCSMLTWSEVSVGRHGVQGNDWSLQMSSFGDPAKSDMILDVFGQGLSSITLYGRDALMAFDAVNVPNPGGLLDDAQIENLGSKSPGSGNGLPFTLRNELPNVDQLAVTYFDRLHVGGVGYGDLYLGMQISFSMVLGFEGFTGEMTFRADTDRTLDGARIEPWVPVADLPLPGTLALVGAALLGMRSRLRRDAEHSSLGADGAVTP